MPIFSRKEKCVFCDRNKGLFHSVKRYGMYGEVGGRIHFHPECLELTQMYPEAFGHRKVDQALEILDAIKDCKKNFNNKIISDYEAKLEKLRASHFENMMPTK